MAEGEQSPPAGVTPHLTIGHGKAEAAVAFYKTAFGAEEQFRHMAEDGRRIMHCHLKLNGGSLMLNDDFPEMHGGGAEGPPSGTTLHLQVDDADAWWKRALDAGATVRFPLADQFWGDRYGKLDDPFGFTWSIGGPVKP
jgi:PhnB protein